jgi:hypothetical protein
LTRKKGKLAAANCECSMDKWPLEQRKSRPPLPFHPLLGNAASTQQRVLNLPSKAPNQNTLFEFGSLGTGEDDSIHARAKDVGEGLDKNTPVSTNDRVAS